jgi:cell division protease FtsH
MDETLGQVSYAPEQSRFLGQDLPYGQSAREYSEQTAAQIDQAVRALTGEALARARSILESHRAQLDETAARLLEKETLSADELPRIDVDPTPASRSA